MQYIQKNYKLPNSKLSSGFTLLEILVSLLILTIGIVSFALLQVESLRTTHNAMQRTKAIHFANDMMERISANTVGITDYDSVAGTAPAACSATAAIPIDCTAVQIANYDVWEWSQALQDGNSGIANGTGEITVTNATSPYNVSIAIAWSDRDEDSTYTLNSVVLR